MIPFKKIILPESTMYEVNKLLEIGMIGLGNKVFEFEKALADYVGSDYVVATDSCTSALMLSLAYEDKNSMIAGRRMVGIPSMTVPLVPAAAIEAGKKIYLTGETAWVGSAYLIEGSDVIDSAHELERDTFKIVTERLKVSPEKAKVCFSFYPTKNIGSADGGAIATNDKDFAEWARSISTYGRNQKAKYQNSWDYDIDLIGYKRHYTNLQAVICHEQLKVLDERNEERKRIRDLYNREFKVKNVSLYLYRLQVEDRDKFIKQMNKEGIECGVHFKPLHLMKAYQKVPAFQTDHVENVYNNTVSIPFWYGMTNSDIENVMNAIKRSGFEIEHDK